MKKFKVIDSRNMTDILGGAVSEDNFLLLRLAWTGRGAPVHELEVGECCACRDQLNLVLFVIRVA